MSNEDFEYYQQQDDFEDFQPYLDSEPIEIDEQALPAFKTDFSNIIIVDDIPVVASREKYSKLLTVLLKVYGQVYANVKESDIYMPFDETRSTSFGFCTITFPNADIAKNAIDLTQGTVLGKNVFKVNLYTDLEIYDKISENDVAPELTNFHARPECDGWLKDPQVRDQFSIRHNRETEIMFMNTTAQDPPSLVYGGEREKVRDSKGHEKVWCELTTEWSPQGTYFVTFHTAGVRLWGGNDFRPLGKFGHLKVEEISFSTCENYLTTYRLFDQNPQLDPKEAIIVWDVRTGQKLRTFPLRSPLDKKLFAQAVIQIEDPRTFKKIEKTVRGKIKDFDRDMYSIEEGNVVHERIEASAIKAMQDPNKLKWSADGQFFARVSADMISIYRINNTPASPQDSKVELLDSKSFAAQDVLDFVWSPKANLISYWSPAVGNHPALISIVQIPERREIGSRKLVDVIDGKMLWQSEGDYLCVYMTKTQNKKKTYVFLFFRLNVAGVPVEQLELLEQINQVSWEPAGDRIAISHGDARNPTISFYSMTLKTTVTAKTKSGALNTTVTKSNQVTHLYSKTGVQCNDIQWSPAGNFIALTYFASDCCRFELHDVEGNISLGTRQHDRGNRLYWDPSGRYIATCTITEIRNNAARGHMDDGVNFYHFQGSLVYQLKKEKLNVFQWRPRPQLLTAAEKKAVSKGLRKYEKMFEDEDKKRKEALNKEIREARFQLAKEFITLRNKNRAINAQLKPLRVQSRGGYDSDDDRNYEIIIVDGR